MTYPGPTGALHSLLIRARYAYYVKGEPYITDGEYDFLEKEWLRRGGTPFPVGSDREEDYPDWAKA